LFPPRRTVLLLHGIIQNRGFLWPLALYLRARGHRTLNFGYPSTRHPIEELARRIALRIGDEHARAPIERLDLVGHSMGGLIARRLLAHESIPPAGRLVQVGPPNRGSEVARRWRGCAIYRALYGTSAGWQLGEGPEEIDRICGVPEEVEWGIVMADAPPMIRAWLPAPNDGVVSHAEMRMGSQQSTRAEGGHTLSLFFPETWRRIATFLETGRFPSCGEPEA
jgi:pimeloyl-ACP methyl ester carboxylesterase